MGAGISKNDIKNLDNKINDLVAKNELTDSKLTTIISNKLSTSNGTNTSNVTGTSNMSGTLNNISFKCIHKETAATSDSYIPGYKMSIILPENNTQINYGLLGNWKNNDNNRKLITDNMVFDEADNLVGINVDNVLITDLNGASIQLEKLCHATPSSNIITNIFDHVPANPTSVQPTYNIFNNIFSNSRTPGSSISRTSTTNTNSPTSICSPGYLYLPNILSHDINNNFNPNLACFSAVPTQPHVSNINTICGNNNTLVELPDVSNIPSSAYKKTSVDLGYMTCALPYVGETTTCESGYTHVANILAYDLNSKNAKPNLSCFAPPKNVSFECNNSGEVVFVSDQYVPSNLVPSIFTRSTETAPVLNIACATERHT